MYYITFLLIGLVHFGISFFYTQSPYIDESIEQKIYYYTIKTLSFIIINGFWLLTAICIKGCISKNEKIIQLTKYFLSYFLLSIGFLFLIQPIPYLSDFSIFDNFNAMYNYSINWHPNWLQQLFISLSYSFLPLKYIWSLSIFGNLLYSLIFAYLFYNSKKYLSQKYSFLLLFLFCLPVIFIINTVPSRNILSAWLFIFLNAFILFNRNKSINNLYVTCGLGFISGILSAIRSEYIVMIPLLIIFVLLFKIFEKKYYIIYTLILITVFSGCISIQQFGHRYWYELHNLSFIYEEFYSNNIYDNQISENAEMLNKIYSDSISKYGSPMYSAEYDLSDETASRKSIKLITLAAVKHPVYFMKMHFDTISSNSIILQNTANNSNIPKKLYNHPRKMIIKNLLTLGNYKEEYNKVSKIIYNPFMYIYLLFILMLVNLFMLKDKFVVFFTLQWLSIFSLIWIFTVCDIYYYVFAFEFNIFMLFIITIIRLLEKYRNHLHI